MPRVLFFALLLTIAVQIHSPGADGSGGNALRGVPRFATGIDSLVSGAETPPRTFPTAAPLDEALLEDLAEEKPQPARPAEGVDRELIQDLIQGEDIGEKPQDPLQQIAEQMKQSQRRMTDNDTSDDTQELQQNISQSLAKLIEQVQKQGKSGGGKPNKSGKGGGQGGEDGGNPSPSPASESTQRVDRSETIERDAADVKDMLRRVWGHLPEKMREQMQSSLDDQFLPKYEKLIEDYYRRLAEDRNLGP